MTTLYRPVLLESIEQALSMPAATVFIGEAGARYDHRGDGRLRDHNGVDLATDLGTSREVTALVPVEVEVEHLRTHAGATKTLYVTDWTQEDA